VICGTLALAARLRPQGDGGDAAWTASSPPRSSWSGSSRWSSHSTSCCSSRSASGSASWSS